MTAFPDSTVETPSGKGAGDENFPVGSFLLPKRLRPHVAKYYAFARAIDDIADNPKLKPEEKIERLEGFADAILGRTGDLAFAKAIALRASMLDTNVDLKHALDLISAFKQDAVKLRYRDWEEMMNYCDRSASPVGRYLLELHGEDPAAFRFSDALCNTLQVINHLQDCRDDYLNLDRVYLPQDWLTRFGGKTEDLKAAGASPGLLKTIRRCVTESRRLMETADALPRHLKSRALAAESAVIVKIAHRLLDRLEAEDPLHHRVKLTGLQVFGCGVRGVASAWFGSKH